MMPCQVQRVGGLTHQRLGHRFQERTLSWSSSSTQDWPWWAGLLAAGGHLHMGPSLRRALTGSLAPRGREPARGGCRDPTAPH